MESLNPGTAGDEAHTQRPPSLLGGPSPGSKRPLDQDRPPSLASVSYPPPGRSSHPGAGGYKRSRPSFEGGGPRHHHHHHQMDHGSVIVKQLLVAVNSEKVFQLAEVLVGEAQKYNGAAIISSTVLACVEAFPTKTATYALLVGVLASKEATKALAGSVLVDAVRRIRVGFGRRERLLIRFVGACIKACGVESAGFFDVLDALIEVDDEEVEVDRLKESQIFTALSSIPWFAISASAARADEEEDASCANRLRAICDRLSRVKRSPTLPARLAPLPRVQQNRGDPTSDRVAMGLAMAAEGSGNRLLLQEEQFDTLLVSSAQLLPRFGECEFPELSDSLTELKVRISATHKSADRKSLPADDFCSTLLPLFPNGQPNEVLQMQRKEKWIDRFLIREKSLDVLGSYRPKATEAADALTALNSPYVVVESVFSAMLQMPVPEHSVLYYSDVLAKLCIKNPSEIPAAIEDALDQILMFEPEGLDPDALDRLAQWLVQHLLEFDLDWPWVKWRLVPTMDEKRSVRQLVEQVLQRLDAILPSRSELENPEKEVPQELLAMLPVKQPAGESEYFAEGNNGLGDDLVALIKTKPSAAQLGAFLEARAPEPEWNTGSRTKFVVQSALFAGRASYTHTRAALERVGAALVGLTANVDDDEERIVAKAALDSAVSFWISTPAWAVVAIGALVDVGVASPSFTLRWLAESEKRLSAYWRRRAMEDVLARISGNEERNAAIDQAASGDTDEATDLWLSRRRLDA